MRERTAGRSFYTVSRSLYYPYKVLLASVVVCLRSRSSLPRNKAAHPFHWMKVRGTLDDFGFLDRDKFFDAVRERSPAA